MSVEYTYDEERNILYTRFFGVLVEKDLRDQAEAVAADPRIRPGTRELVDLPGIEDIQGSASALEQNIRIDTAHSERLAGMRTAIVATTDLSASVFYGLLSPMLTPTLADSAATFVYTAFYISAHTTTPAVFFESPPDSGYSVDNIAPGVPLGLAVAYNTGSGNELTWDPAPEPDFQYYRIYRGTDPEFIPVPGTTTVYYDVPAGGGDVSIRIFDVSGRLVRTLVDGHQAAGSQSVTWNGVNDCGQSAASGIYFYRMTAPGFARTRKMALLR